MEPMTSSLPRYRVLDVPFHPIDNVTARAQCLAAAESDHFHLMVTLGTEMVMNAQHNGEFKRIVEGAEIVVPDGIGLVLAARLAGLDAPERVAGVELVKELIKSAPPETSFFFYGAAPGVAQAAVDRLNDDLGGINCAGVLDGYVQDPEEVLSAIETASPKVLLVALGSPRQEDFLEKNRLRLESCGVRLGVGVGGSFDVYSGTVERAPVWAQKLHIEWLYRILSQPSRWRRSLMLPQFALRVLLSPKRAVQVIE